MASLRGKRQYTGARAPLAEFLFDRRYTALDRELERVGFRFVTDTSILRALRIQVKRTARVPPLMQGLAAYNTSGHLVFMLTPNLENEGYLRKEYPWVLRSFYRDSELGIDLPGGHAYVSASQDLAREIRSYVAFPNEVAEVVLYRKPSRPVRRRKTEPKAISARQPKRRVTRARR